MQANHQRSDVYGIFKVNLNKLYNKALFTAMLASCLGGQVVCICILIARDNY